MDNFLTYLGVSLSVVHCSPRCSQISQDLFRREQKPKKSCFLCRACGVVWKTALKDDEGNGANTPHFWHMVLIKPNVNVRTNSKSQQRRCGSDGWLLMCSLTEFVGLDHRRRQTTLLFVSKAKPEDVSVHHIWTRRLTPNEHTWSRLNCVVTLELF